MSLVGTGSPTSKTLKKRCSSASRRVSRSGLIRELNMRSQLQKSGKRSAARLGVAKRGGEGGVGKCSRHRRASGAALAGLVRGSFTPSQLKGLDHQLRLKA